MTTPSEQKSSDPDYAKAFRNSKDVVWYKYNIDNKITPGARSLLETYSRVPPEEVSKHVHSVRDQAWAIRSYPCTGLGAFLTPLLPLSPAYPSILQTLRSGGSFLDIGCFVGHDLRRLVFDGAPSDRLYGIDIVSHWDVGFELFRDRSRFAARFLENDILHPSTELAGIAQELGGFDTIAVSLVLHQWHWDEQIEALKQVVALSASNGVVVGFQVGNVPAKEQPNAKFGGKASYWHDGETFRRLWGKVGEASGTAWECEVGWKTWEECGYVKSDIAYLGESAGMMGWVARRRDGRDEKE